MLKQDIEKMTTKIENIQNDVKANRTRFRNITLSEFLELAQLPDVRTAIVNGKQKEIKNTIDYLMYVQQMDMEKIDNYIASYFDDKTAAEILVPIHRQQTIQYTQGTMPKDLIDVANQIKQQWDNAQIKSARIAAIAISDTDDEGKELKKAIPIRKGESLTLDQLLQPRMLRYLRNLNRRNYHIFITPDERLDGNPTCILVDDFKMENYDAITSKIGVPNLMIETSKDNYQLIYTLKTKKLTEGQRQKIINAFNELNIIFGDPKCNGLRHPFRLAGFRNRKKGKDGWLTRVYAATKEQAKGLLDYINTMPSTKISKTETIKKVEAERERLERERERQAMMTPAIINHDAAAKRYLTQAQQRRQQQYDTDLDDDDHGMRR